MTSANRANAGRLRTPWTKQCATPVRAYLQTESGSAGISRRGDRGRRRLGEPREGRDHHGVVENQRAHVVHLDPGHDVGTGLVERDRLANHRVRASSSSVRYSAW